MHGTPDPTLPRRLRIREFLLRWSHLLRSRFCSPRVIAQRESSRPAEGPPRDSRRTEGSFQSLRANHASSSSLSEPKERKGLASCLCCFPSVPSSPFHSYPRFLSCFLGPCRSLRPGQARLRVSAISACNTEAFHSRISVAFLFRRALPASLLPLHRPPPPFSPRTTAGRILLGQKPIRDSDDYAAAARKTTLDRGEVD